MLKRHGKAFAFSPREIRCIDPTIVELMVIFTVPHVPWNLKPIPVPRAHILKLMELLIHGNPRIVECPTLELVVHNAEEE